MFCLRIIVINVPNFFGIIFLDITIYRLLQGNEEHG